MHTLSKSVHYLSLIISHITINKKMRVGMVAGAHSGSIRDPFLQVSFSINS